MVSDEKILKIYKATADNVFQPAENKLAMIDHFLNPPFLHFLTMFYTRSIYSSYRWFYLIEGTHAISSRGFFFVSGRFTKIMKKGTILVPFIKILKIIEFIFFITNYICRWSKEKIFFNLQWSSRNSKTHWSFLNYEIYFSCRIKCRWQLNYF